MKRIIKVLLFLLLGLYLINSVSANLIINNTAYYTLDNTLNDSTGNGNTLTNVGAIYNSSGKINGAYNWNGTGSYMTAQDNTSLDIANNLSISFWINPSILDSTNRLIIIKGRDSGDVLTNYAVRIGINNGIEFYYNDGTIFNIWTQTTPIFVINNWYHVVVEYSGTNASSIKLFINNVSQIGSWTTGTGTTALITNTELLQIGAINTLTTSSFFFAGTIDEISIWKRLLNITEISQLYNSGIGLQYPYGTPQIKFENISINNQTFVNNSFFNTSSLNFNITLNTLNTNNNTNQTFYLYNSTGSLINSTQYATNNITGNFSLNLSDGTYQISFHANNNETNITSSNYTFLVDITPSTINFSSNTNLSTYFIENWSRIFNYTNHLLDNLTIEIPKDNITLTGNYTSLYLTNYTFHYNGNQSLIVVITNEFGTNITKNNTFFINPINYFYFKDENNNSITNFSIDNINYTNYATIQHYDLGLGNHTLNFLKIGYIPQTFNINFNSTNQLNNTYTITTSKITIYIRDKNTLSIINTSNFSIQIIGGIGLQTNTLTGIKNISNIFFTNGQYQLLVSATDYYAEDIYFNFTNEEHINLDIYVTNINQSNAGLITISVVNGLGQAIPSAIVQALQWDGNSSKYISVSEGQTGLDGKISLNVLLENKIYIFRALNNGITSDSPSYRLLITDNGKTITIPLTSTVGERTYLFRNLIYNISEISHVGNITTIQFNWIDKNGLSQNICLNVYRYIGINEHQLSINCTSGTSGSFIQTFILNTSQDISIKGEVKIGNAFYPLKSFSYPSNNSLPNIISFLKFEFIIIPLLYLLSVAIGIKLNTLYLGIFLLILSSGISLWLVPTMITGEIVVFLDLVGMIMLWSTIGGRK